MISYRYVWKFHLLESPFFSSNAWIILFKKILFSRWNLCGYLLFHVILQGPAYHFQYNFKILFLICFEKDSVMIWNILRQQKIYIILFFCFKIFPYALLAIKKNVWWTRCYFVMYLESFCMPFFVVIYFSK